MANIDAPSGFRPVRHLDGRSWNGSTRMYLVPSGDNTALFVGDAVKSGGSAGAAGTVVNGIDVEGMQTVIQAAATDALIVGVVVGFLPNQDNLMTKYRVASTNRIALVCDDPSVVFEVQEDSVTNTLVADDMGENADLTVGSGSTTTGMSAMELDSSDHKTATAQLRILGLVKRPGNTQGDSATSSASTNVNARYEVLINEHAYKSTTGT